MRLFYLREHLRTSLWFIPTLCVGLAFALALLLAEVDRNVQSGLIERITFEGDAENARSFLTTISSSMITLTGLVFTITIVVLQLASQQLSPRVLRTFLRDRLSQLSLGVFIGTFAFSIAVLREMRPLPTGAVFVPNISITVGYLLVLLSVGFFVAYIHHISQSIRIGAITHSIAREARAAISHIYDHDLVGELLEPPSGSPDLVLMSPRAGVVEAMDRDGLVEAARAADVVLEVVPAVGDFVPKGAPILHVHGRRDVDPEIAEHIALGQERTMEQDPSFGFRQLVDIAQRALSPAVNDPTTAVQAVDLIHDLLRRLVVRPFPSGQRFDRDGNLRLIFPVTKWDGYVSIACLELRHYGERSIQVMRRMRAMLEDLRTVAPSDRLEPIERELRLLDGSIDRAWPDPHDRKVARAPDQQGVGD